MAEYKWPDPDKRTFIGTHRSRLDGRDKVTGRARYASDVSRPGMLFGKVLRSPYARCKIAGIDTSAAERMPGVKIVHVIQGEGTEIRWLADEIALVAAETREQAEDAARAIRVQYERLEHYVVDTDPQGAGERTRPTAAQTKGDADAAMSEAEVVIEGSYGMPVITHCCLEPHGAVTEWEDENSPLVHISTQWVSGIAGQMAGPLEVPASNIRVLMDHIGGGFGAKFTADRWTVEAAKASKKVDGRPIKIFLERDAELLVAGARPSIFGKIKLGAKKDGTITAWMSETWGTGGVGGSGAPQIPYVFDIPNQARRHTGIQNNIGSQRAWRAPNHPQGCFLTMCAMEDLAAEIEMDPVDLFLKNIELTARPEVYREQFRIAADLIGWKRNWHPRGDKTAGANKRGLGVAIHTWGGAGHASDCDITINPDGSVEVKIATQDLGTGTRTAIVMVAADTFGIPMEEIKLMIGDNRYPTSGGSGGSTTIGGVTAATRRGALDALDQLFEKVAPSLNSQPADLEAVGGVIRVKAEPGRNLTWAQACRALGAAPLTVRGKNPGPGTLTTQGVGGVQMADVSVDIETGVVKMNKIVAVQDCGLIINMKTAESQVHGALIMGVCYSLYEEKIMDARTGKMLNPNMEFYKLAGIGDIGEMVVHMMTGPGHDERGVIGLGEPPVIAPGAAISNAVANAIGVRVPELPLTPDRVLEALEKKGGSRNASI